MRAAANLVGAQRGLLLLEALLTLAVFGAGVLGTIVLQAQVNRHLGDAHYRADAAQLAQALLARMWADDPAALAERYDSARAGRGYQEFAALAATLPGAASPGNAPRVEVTAGPSAASRGVAIAVRWQAPGEAQAHAYALAAVIGRNAP